MMLLVFHIINLFLNIYKITKNNRVTKKLNGDKVIVKR